MEFNDVPIDIKALEQLPANEEMIKSERLGRCGNSCLASCINSCPRTMFAGDGDS